jgi:aminoglycoside phosphotransferase (APT) family kinase protein
MTGGVSAQVTAIDAALPGGDMRRLVLRQYGAANLRSDPQIAAHEYQLLSMLHRAGLPVPRPYHADQSCAILPVPWLAVEFIDGEPAGTGPLAPRDFTWQLASTLAHLHAAALTADDAPFLADAMSKATRKIGSQPACQDEPLNEAAVRAALTRAWPPPQVNPPVLLHGDYWPGNTLWRHDTLVAVIDWEDALVGDPLVDVGNIRMELSMAFSTEVAAEFTRHYGSLLPSADMAALPCWDLYAALRHAGKMTGWGLSAADLARFRTGHREFSDSVLALL